MQRGGVRCAWCSKVAVTCRQVRRWVPDIVSTEVVQGKLVGLKKMAQIMETTRVKTASYSSRTSVMRAAIATVALCGSTGTAWSFSFDTGNPDLKIRWDNTVRYNLGFRAEDCDRDICGDGAGRGDVTAYQSDRKFAKAGDIVTNRLDLLSEFDFTYKRDHGFRVSAAGWYDAAYDGDIKGDPALDASGVGMGAGRTGGPYPDYTKRWNRGPSGEILDAFLFTKVAIGEVPVNLKLGKHNIYWGESLFSAVGGVAYNQGPLDFRKALANPGVEAKEVFKPLNQASMSAQLTPTLGLAAQYYLDWKPTELPDGGTYFGAADGFGLGGTGTIFGVPTAVSHKPDKTGDWGLALRWQPEWLDGTMGFYYREFTNKFPQLVSTPAGFLINFSADDREKLIGFSLAKQIWGISFGTDLTYRPDAVLAATPFATFVPTGAPDSSWKPRGDIFTGVLNAIAYFGANPVFDSAALTAEVNFAHLVKVTDNPQNYNGVGYNCVQPRKFACQTRNAVGINLLFEPKWFQVMDGVDVSMPISYGQGLDGNSPVIFGDNEGQGSWSIGAKADVYNKYSVSLKYNGFIAKHGRDELGALSDNNSSLGKYWDRNWVSLTFKTTF